MRPGDGTGCCGRVSGGATALTMTMAVPRVRSGRRVLQAHRRSESIRPRSSDVDIGGSAAIAKTLATSGSSRRASKFCRQNCFCTGTRKLSDALGDCSFFSPFKCTAPCFESLSLSAALRSSVISCSLILRPRSRFSCHSSLSVPGYSVCIWMLGSPR
jgi:hypothetical protein